MVLGKLPVPGRPTIWITVGQGPTALAVGAGWGCLDIFSLIYPFFPLSPSLWETTRYRLKYCLKGPLNPKSTNQPTRRLLTRTDAIEEKRLRVNAGKTKIMIRETGLKLLQSSGEFSCAVRRTGVGSNIFCKRCKHWVYKKCGGLKPLTGLVGCFGFNGHSSQYFSLSRTVSRREGDRREK